MSGASRSRMSESEKNEGGRVYRFGCSGDKGNASNPEHPNGWQSGRALVIERSAIALKAAHSFRARLESRGAFKGGQV